MSDFSDTEDSDFEVGALEESFGQAAEHVQRIHTNIDPNNLLELYAFYKQATVGPCKVTKPGVFSMQARAKWNAWNELGDMTPAVAKRLYLEKVQKIDPAWSILMQRGETLSSASSWVVHSIQQIPPEELIKKEEHEKTAWDYVKEGNLFRLKEVLRDPHSLQQLDEHGMGLTHWATDRNFVNILEFLLTSGVNVNLRDAEQQTALHYAASCGHLDCVRLLLNFNADQSLKDSEGQTCFDVAYDATVRALFKI